MSFAWLIAVSGTGLWFCVLLEGQGFSQKPVHHVQQNTDAQQHGNSSTCPYFSPCLSLLNGLVWVCSVCGLYICTVLLKSIAVVFQRTLLSHKVVQGNVKTGLPNCVQLLPSRASIQPRQRVIFFWFFYLSSVSLGREACCCRTVCWAWDSQSDREACGKEW